MPRRVSREQVQRMVAEQRSEQDQAKLFRQDKHISNVGTANERGTGLGLLLCKEFVEKNNGSIELESEKGKGSTFIIRLPLAKVAVS